MNITTKYNIGDTVWTVKDNKAYELVISHINIEVIERGQEITYYNSIMTIDSISRKEEEVCLNKEELINLL